VYDACNRKDSSKQLSAMNVQRVASGLELSNQSIRSPGSLARKCASCGAIRDVESAMGDFFSALVRASLFPSPKTASVMMKVRAFPSIASLTRMPVCSPALLSALSLPSRVSSTRNPISVQAEEVSLLMPGFGPSL
jgi:hypothetical protein